MKCKICEQRKPRRYCPGVLGDICSICCGSEREITIDCPFECGYLREAHMRENPPEPCESAGPDIEVSERFVREHEKLVMDLLAAIFDAAMNTSGTVDFDVRAALDALIRTFRTRESGLYYDTRPEDRVAAALYDSLQEFIGRAQKEASGKTMSIRDSEILKLLTFAQLLELRRNNGRKRGRAFLDSLRMTFAQEPGTQGATPLLVMP